MTTRPTRRAALAAGACAVLLTGCGLSGDPLEAAGGGGEACSTEQPQAGPIKVGAADFPESQLIAELYAGALKAKGVNASTTDPIGAREAYLQALGDGADVHAHAGAAFACLRVVFHETAAGQRAAVLGRLGEVAALPQDARAAALAALEEQLGQVQPRALQLGAQAALAQVHTVQQGADAQLVGAEHTAPLRRAAGARERDVGIQAAADAPSGRGEQGPQADVGHAGLEGT